jgi:hypothetical protein
MAKANPQLASVGKSTGWMCLYCHRKTSGTIDECHPLHAILVTRTDGKQAVAHKRCFEDTSAGKEAASSAPLPSSTHAFVRELTALRSVRDEATLMLDLAGIPEGDLMERLQIVIDVAAAPHGPSEEVSVELESLRAKAKLQGEQQQQLMIQIADVKAVNENLHRTLQEAEDRAKFLADKARVFYNFADALREVLEVSQKKSEKKETTE